MVGTSDVPLGYKFAKTGMIETASRCRLCGGMAAATYTVREMMLGTREEFLYVECASCGCLQRDDVNLDVAPYYPSHYYAFAAYRPGTVRRLARRLRNMIALSPKSPLGGILQRILPHAAYPWISLVRPRRDARIIDLGCGNGRLLRELAEAGYTNLTGVDPFLPDQPDAPATVRLVRADIEDVGGEFDVVMLHHSLEHIADQQGAMRTIARLLAPKGVCVIRIPTVSSEAWRTYREHWFQIDAPRHAVLHSVDSIRSLGASVGLKLERLEFDSKDTQILISERYRRGQAMSEGPSEPRHVRAAARREARRLNAAHSGDQIIACFRRT